MKLYSRTNPESEAIRDLMGNNPQDVGLKPGLIAGTNPRPEGRGNGALLPGRQLVLKIHCPVL